MREQASFWLAHCRSLSSDRKSFAAIVNKDVPKPLRCMVFALLDGEDIHPLIIIPGAEPKFIKIETINRFMNGIV